MISIQNLMGDSAHHFRMGREECRKLHMATLEILERTGVDVHYEKARNILVAGGAKKDGLRIRIPEYMVERALAQAPKRITLYNRNQNPVIRAWGSNTYFGGGSDCLNILDHRSGGRRRAELEDVKNACIIMDALPEVDFVMSLFLPKDVDQQIYDRYQTIFC